MKKTNTLKTTERYNPSLQDGLSFSQVNERIKNKLTNSTEKRYSKSYFNIFFQNIFTFFNLLGLIVTVALIIVKAPLTSFFFVLIYCANIGIGIIQEIRAKLTIDKLSLLSSKTTKVIRSGETQEIQSKEIVLDDILVLSIGNQVPTDSIVMEGIIEVNESLLTGESVPIKKKVGDCLYAGSFIVSGTCKAKAHKVGKDNYVEQLSAKAKKYKKPYSEIMSSLYYIIKIVSCVIVPIAALFILKAVLKKQDLTESVIKTSSVVIGMIPSGMFLLTTMALAVGVIKLSKHNTLVQDLYSLEMLARVDTICFDKTGTITDGKMSVKRIIPLQNKLTVDIPTVIGSMLNCLRDNNQTALALTKKFGYSKKLIGESTLPFNSARKLSAVSFKNYGTYAFGAPEFILQKTSYLQIEYLINDYAKQGYRVILLAHSIGKIINEKVPNDFVPVALILLTDNIRKDAIETVKWFKENDVQIKVISGDNPITVSEVSKRVGIENADKIINLEGMSDEQVFNIANTYTVFGRVTPEQKAILLKSMKLAGHVTAMTGDGVNDILAMKEADCAITVAAGSEAARNVSNLVLTDNNFNAMPHIVKEGRRVINNVQSSASLYLMKTLFTMILSVLILCVPSIIYYPFELQQLILIEVFIIGLPSFFLSLQPNDMRVQGKFINYVISKSLPSAILMVSSVILIKILNFVLPAGSRDLLTTVEVYAFTFAGLISLGFICKPYNTYRTVLFTVSSFAVLAIIVYSFIFGLSYLSFSSLIPIGENLYPLISIAITIVLEIPLYLLFTKLCNKIKIGFKTQK